MTLAEVLFAIALLGSCLSIPVQPELPAANVVLPPRAINPIYLDAAKAEWSGPESLRQRDFGSRRESVPRDVYEGNDWSNFDIPGAKRDVYEGNDWSDIQVPGARDLVEDWSRFEAPRAINPIYQNVSHESVYKRAESGPIYGGDGKPVIGDVHQTTNPSCGFASALAAVVNVNPAWISTHLDFSGNPKDISTVKVNMYDPESFAPRSFDITCSETSTKSDVDPATGIWWPGAYDHAAVKLGLPNSNGAMGPILPITSLQAITGLKGASEDRLSADRLFELAQTAKSRNTPMVLQTNGDGVRTLVGGHAYALLDGQGSGDSRKIVLFNPWGSHVTVDVNSIVGETYCVWRLRDYNTFTGDGGQQQEPPKNSPAPQPQNDQPTSTRRRGGSKTGQVNAVQPTVEVKPQPRPQPQDGVVWVTEVVTVTVQV